MTEPPGDHTSKSTYENSPLASPPVVPKTIWDVQVGTGQTLRQSVWSALITWLLSGVGGFVYWRQSSVYKHETITKNDWHQLSYLGLVHLLILAAFIFLYLRLVVPGAREDLARLRAAIKVSDGHKR
jgi:hypothetical protein